MIEHRAYFCDNPKRMEKSYWVFVEATSFMLTVDTYKVMS